MNQQPAWLHQGQCAFTWAVAIAMTLTLACVPSPARGDTPPAVLTPGPSPTPAPLLATTPVEDPAFTQRLARADALIAKVKTLRAGFEQAKHTPMLKRPLVSSGTVVSAAGTVKWTTTTPRAMTMLVTPTALSILYPQDNRVEVYPMGAEFRDLAGAPLPSIDALRGRFWFAQMPLAELGVTPERERRDGAELLGVKLTPKDASLARHVSSVGVLLDLRIPAATRVVIVDGDLERTEMTLFDVRVNVVVPAAELGLNTPEGTTTVFPLGPVLPATPTPTPTPAPTSPAAGPKVGG